MGDFLTSEKKISWNPFLTFYDLNLINKRDAHGLEKDNDQKDDHQDDDQKPLSFKKLEEGFKKSFHDDMIKIQSQQSQYHAKFCIYLFINHLNVFWVFKV